MKQCFNLRKRIHTRTCKHARTRGHTHHTHKHTHTHIHAHTHRHINTHSHRHTHTQRHIHTFLNTDRHTDRHTDTQTHTRTHTPFLKPHSLLPHYPRSSTLSVTFRLPPTAPSDPPPPVFTSIPLDQFHSSDVQHRLLISVPTVQHCRLVHTMS